MDHPSEPLFEEGCCCALWERAPLANDVLTRERYLAAGHVVVMPGQGKPALEDWFVQRLGGSRRIEVTTFSFAAAAQLVAGTNRIATMHRRLGPHAQRSEPVVIRDVPLPIPPMQQTVQWHTHRSADPGLLWLRGVLREAATAMDGQRGRSRRCVTARCRTRYAASIEYRWQCSR